MKTFLLILYSIYAVFYQWIPLILHAGPLIFFKIHRINRNTCRQSIIVFTCVQSHINTFSFSSAVAWELGTSLSTSLEVERPPNVRLQGAFQHNVIDVSASTPFCFSFFFVTDFENPKDCYSNFTYLPST